MKKSNASLSAVIALLITFGSFGYAWKVLVPEYQSNQNALTLAEDETTAAQAKLESLSTAKASLDSLGDLPKRLSLAIPADADTPNLITELEAIGVKHSIAIPSIQVSGASGQAASNTISISFAVDGSFDTLNQFLASLEHDARLMTVKSVSISSSSGSQMSMSLQLEGYTRGESVSLSSTTIGGLR